ncbi:MAG: ASPIC/UnbV domain-containing, partial [Planctomycetota bacterium]
MSTNERAVALLVIALAAGLTGCPGSGPVAKPKPPPADYLPVAEVKQAPLPEVTYTDVTEASGVRFHGENGAFGKKFLPETMGAGVALFDADGDGRLDIFFVNGQRWPGHDAEYKTQAGSLTLKLFRNLGGLRFEDHTRAAGLELSLMGMGVTAADVDDDGDTDLFVTGVGKNLFLRNTRGVFADETERVGLVSPTWTDPKGQTAGSWGTSAAFFDYDKDGRLDLFVANYVRWSEGTDIFTTMDGSTKAYTTPELYPGDTCRLYRNTGERFEDVTQKSGVFREDGKAL